MIRHLSLLCSFVAICNMLLFCLYWLNNYMLFKLASIADILLAIVFSSLWFYHLLCITYYDISANVEGSCYFENIGGTENDLNHIISIFGDADHEIVNFCNSRYITLSDTASTFQKGHNEFITLSRNVQSNYAKFNQLYPIGSKLSLMGFYLGAICLQETWLASDTEFPLLQLLAYKIIHQDSKCMKHGRLIIYLS